MKKPNTISIVIPVYNERKYIKKVVERVKNSDTLGLKKEIIIVDDGSTDGTIDQLEKLAESNSRQIKLILNKVNRGKGAVLKDGLIKTTGDIVLIQDADLEYNPTDYPSLLEPFIISNADIVYGSRLSTTKPHRVFYFWHYLINNFLTGLSNIFTNLNLTDMETGYKVFNGDIIRKIAPRLESKRFGFEPEITARVAKHKELKIFEVGISYYGRTYKEGKKINWKDGLLAIWEIIYFNLFAS